MKAELMGAGIFALCQAVRLHLEYHDTRGSFAGGRVRLTRVRNEGAAFGLPLGRQTVAAGSAAALTAAWLLRQRSPVGAGLLLGGGCSNLWERLRRGGVLDYVQFPKAGRLLRTVFNLADFSIFLGVLLLLTPRGRQ